MANASQKRIAAENARALKILRYGFLLVNSIHLLVRFYLRRATVGKWQITFYTTTEVLALALWFQLVRMGTPKYDAKGALRSAGDELAQSGLTAYMFDIIYVTWFVHVLTALISDKFWWLYLSIPSYALYILYQKILLPFLFGGKSPFRSLSELLSRSPSSSSGPNAASGAEAQDTQETLSKRQAKLQKRAERGDPRVQQRKAGGRA